LDLVLHGGEEYEAVLSVPSSKLPAAALTADKLNLKLYPFGHVAAGGPRVVYSPRGERARKVAAEGWVHLR
jgi:thiamine monophosphate kinase